MFNINFIQKVSIFREQTCPLFVPIPPAILNALLLADVVDMDKYFLAILTMARNLDSFSFHHGSGHMLLIFLSLLFALTVEPRLEEDLLHTFPIKYKSRLSPHNFVYT